jgi:hypothetical protein
MAEDNFEVLFKKALDICAEDTDAANPNRAPRECWPSTQTFRGLIHRAGRYEESAAAKHLDRIPDDGVRLFAQIELAAAMAKLPMIGGRWIAPQPPEKPEEKLGPCRRFSRAGRSGGRGEGTRRSVQTEAAEWMPAATGGLPPRESSVTLFREDGQPVESERHNVDGTTHTADMNTTKMAG